MSGNDVAWVDTSQETYYSNIVTTFRFDHRNITFYLTEQYSLDESEMLMRRVAAYAFSENSCRSLRAFEARSRRECSNYVAEVCNFADMVVEGVKG